MVGFVFSAQLDPLRKPPTKPGTAQRLGAERAEETHRTRFRADPDFPGASVKIELPFLLNLRGGVARREDFHANLRRLWEAGAIAQLAHDLRRSPRDISSLDAVCGGDRTFRQHST